MQLGAPGVAPLAADDGLELDRDGGWRSTSLRTVAERGRVGIGAAERGRGRECVYVPSEFFRVPVCADADDGCLRGRPVESAGRMISRLPP